MKIAHICMSAPYIDGWGYQENLLPKYMASQGIETIVIASNILPSYQNNATVPIGEYYIDNVKIIRVACIRKGSSLTFSRGLMSVLEKERPDVVFHHNLNFPTHIICNRYCVKNGKIMFEDNHADFINCIKNKFIAFIFYRCLNGFITRLFSKSVIKFYGVTHSRCDFLISSYGIPSKKVELLPIGADVESADLIKDKVVLREEYGYSSSETIIVSGGKMGVDKGTFDLIKIISELHIDNPSLRLILFGKFSDTETELLASRYNFIKCFGWCDRKKTLELLKLSDLACWPIHHTTLCEDAVACSVPLLLRKTRTTEHLINGNGFFMETGNESELRHYIQKFIGSTPEKKKEFQDKSVAMRNNLSYITIANSVKREIVKFYEKKS